MAKPKNTLSHRFFAWADDDKKQARAWVVDVKEHEISLIRKDFHHGFRSYGWEDTDRKRTLWHGEEPLPLKTRLTLIAEAHDIAETLNRRDEVMHG